MYRFSLVFIPIVMMLLSGQDLLSQKNAVRPKERMEVAKKMRLLEILDLNETEAEKVLIKYTLLEKAIREKNDAFRDANDGLIEYIDKSPKGKELSDMTNKVISSQKELHAAVEAKLTGMRQLLGEENFAKFIAFESNFTRQMRKMLMNRDMPGVRPDGPPDGPPYDDSPPKRKSRR